MFVFSLQVLLKKPEQFEGAQQSSLPAIILPHIYPPLDLQSSKQFGISFVLDWGFDGFPEHFVIIVPGQCCCNPPYLELHYFRLFSTLQQSTFFVPHSNPP